MCSILVRITPIFKCLSYLLLKLGTIASGMLPHSRLPVFKLVWEEFRLALSDPSLHSHPRRFILVKLLPPQVAVVRVKQVKFLWCQLWTVNWVWKNKPPFSSDLSPFLSQLTRHHLGNPASTTLWITCSFMISWRAIWPLLISSTVSPIVTPVCCHETFHQRAYCFGFTAVVCLAYSGVACCVGNVTTATLKLNHSTFNSGIMQRRFL